MLYSVHHFSYLIETQIFITNEYNVFIKREVLLNCYYKQITVVSYDI